MTSPESQTSGGVNPPPAAYSDGIFFYRCKGCSRCLVVDRARARLRRLGEYCACGGQEATPGWPAGLEWLRPDIAAFALKRRVHDWLIGD